MDNSKGRGQTHVPQIKHVISRGELWLQSLTGNTLGLFPSPKLVQPVLTGDRE